MERGRERCGERREAVERVRGLGRISGEEEGGEGREQGDKEGGEREEEREKSLECLRGVRGWFREA